MKNFSNELHPLTPLPTTTTTTTTTTTSKPPLITKTTITTTTTKFETVIDDWNTPFSNEELEAIEAAFEAATQQPSTTPSSSSSFRTPRTHFTLDDDGDTRPTAHRRLLGSTSGQNGELEAIEVAAQPSTTLIYSLKTLRSNCYANDDDGDTRPTTRRLLPGSMSGQNGKSEAVEAAKQSSTTPFSSLKTPRSNSYANDEDGDDTRPTTRRRLPGSISSQNGELGSSRNSGSFALTPCSRNRNFRQDTVKMKYPAMNFGGRIVYSRTKEEVEEATLQILKMLEARRCETGRAVLGLDIEWKPSFNRGIPQGKAAVMQICGDMTHCYVLHIFHSGIPGCLQSLLENPTFAKVGVGIDNDAVKVFHDHNVSIKSLEDLSCLANQKLGGVPKQWSLSGLVEMFTCKQVFNTFIALEAKED